MAYFKRWLAVPAVAALSLSLLPTAALSVANAESTQGRNVALASAGTTVSASGQEVAGQWGPDKVNDGVINVGAAKADQSRWSSNTADDAQVTLTFSKPTKIHHVAIHWEVACAAAYHLEVSTDGTTFKRATDTIRPTCGTADGAARDEQKLTKVSADAAYKAVRMQAEDRTPFGGVKYGVSLWEFEVWDGPQANTNPSQPAANTGLGLVPLPAELKDNSASQDSFELSQDTKLVAPGAAKDAAELFAAQARLSTGYPLPVVDSGEASGNITFKTGAVAGHSGDEAYALTSTKSGVTITANAAHGFFNATQTLRQLLPGFINSKYPVYAAWEVPAVEIKDSPRYSYRAIMLDPARSFLTVDEVKHVLDQMASLKMSYLHFHLADDQGWRIEITNEGRAEGDTIDYTRLTGVSGRTAMNMHDKAKSNEVGRTGYYTQAQYKEIVAYAAARHITLVPEIDLPGHTNAALHAIPQLNTAGSSHQATTAEPTAPANGTGAVGYSYLDPNSEVSFTFVKHVLGQLAAITPGAYLHVGGDEPHSMTSRYGTAVYNKFLNRVGTIVRDLGKHPIGWNEYAGTDLKSGDAVQYWVGNSASTKDAALNKGTKIVMSRGASSYIDQKYNPKTPIGLNWACAGVCDAPQYYNWDPKTVISGLSDEHILGPEAPLWSETVRGSTEVDLLAWPRGASHAEIGWTPQAKRSVTDFTQRLGMVGTHWNVAGQNFYDTSLVRWNWELAGNPGTSAPTNTSVTFPLGYLSAPGTKVAGNAVSPDSTNDDDGVSNSALPAGTTISVDWGDGSSETTAAVVADTPRDAYHSAGLYRLLGEHKYATAGDYVATLKIGGEEVNYAAIHVADDAAAPQLPAAWDASVSPKVTIEKTTLTVGERIHIEASGFQPGQLIAIKIGDAFVGNIRAGEDGTRVQDLLIDGSMTNGEHDMTFTQGKRVVTIKVTISGGTVPLPHRVATGKVKPVWVDSQEESGETPPNGPVTAAFDGDPNTFWHTRWSAGNDGFPHGVIMKIEAPAGQTCKFAGLEYTGRKGNANSRAKDYRLYVSPTGNKDDWTLVGQGTFKSSDAPQTVLPTAASVPNGCFVYFEQLSSQNGDNYGGAAEIALGATFAAESASPSPAPTASPTAQPTAEPSPAPTSQPTTEPTAEPTAEPTQAPTSEPTAEPTASPAPTAEPTAAPTAEPTQAPTSQPTAEPTIQPTGEPTASPAPTAQPTNPAVEPTAQPTSAPAPTSAVPTAPGSGKPSALPSAKPTVPGQPQLQPTAPIANATTPVVGNRTTASPRGGLAHTGAATGAFALAAIAMSAGGLALRRRRQD